MRHECAGPSRARFSALATLPTLIHHFRFGSPRISRSPIWYQRQGEVSEALGVKRRDEAELLRAKNILVKEVNQHWQDARTTSELLAVFEKGLLGQAQEALRIAQFSFLQGAASLLEVLDAQRVQRQILLDYNQARYDLSVSLARLERASGGVLY